MDLIQFSNEFDIAYNNITSNASPPLNNYEKSVFLTKAQNELVLMYYNGLNGRYTAFEANEEARRYLDPLVVPSSKLEIVEQNKIGSYKYYIYKKPEDLLFILQEFAKKNETKGCVNGQFLNVRPVTYNDLNYIINNPFKGPSSNKVLRTDSQKGISIITVEDLTSYQCTYLRKPKPIIIAEPYNEIQAMGLNIDGYDLPQQPICELPDVLHQKIIDRAVILAKAAYVGEMNTQMALSNQTL